MTNNQKSPAHIDTTAEAAKKAVLAVYPAAAVKEYSISRSTTAYRIVRKSSAVWKHLSDIFETPEKGWIDAANRLSHPPAIDTKEAKMDAKEKALSIPCPKCGMSAGVWCWFGNSLGIIEGGVHLRRYVEGELARLSHPGGELGEPSALSKCVCGHPLCHHAEGHKCYSGNRTCNCERFNAKPEAAPAIEEHEHAFACEHDEQQCDAACKQTHKCLYCGKTREATEVPQEIAPTEAIQHRMWCNLSLAGHPLECMCDAKPESPQAEGAKESETNIMTDQRLDSIYHAATVNGYGTSFSAEAVVLLIDRLRLAESKSQSQPSSLAGTFEEWLKHDYPDIAKRTNNTFRSMALGMYCAWNAAEQSQPPLQKLMKCGHSSWHMLASAENGKDLYCEVCDALSAKDDRITEDAQKIVELEKKNTELLNIASEWRNRAIGAEETEFEFAKLGRSYKNRAEIAEAQLEQYHPVIEPIVPDWILHDIINISGEVAERERNLAIELQQFRNAQRERER